VAQPACPSELLRPLPSGQIATCGSTGFGSIAFVSADSHNFSKFRAFTQVRGSSCVNWPANPFKCGAWGLIYARVFLKGSG
jgi:hypothetical protein